MADVHAALGSDVLEEPAEKRHDVEVGGAETGAAHFPGGERDGMVREADETMVGDGNFEDSGGEGGEGRVAVVIGLTLDIPGDGPDLGSNLLQQTGVAHRVFAEGAGDGGERFDRDKAIGPGGPPGRAVLGEAPPRDDGVDVRVVLELPAPGVQDTGKPRESGPDEAFVGGEPFEG